MGISRLAQSVERSANNAEVPGGTTHGLDGSVLLSCQKQSWGHNVVVHSQVGRNPPPPPVQKRPREQDSDDELERLRVICKALEDHYEYLEKEVKKWRDLYRKGCWLAERESASLQVKIQDYCSDGQDYIMCCSVGY
ncbi:hypothetical protein MP228_010531 [Amoeboaphelidium protococcarum]|nr:hypothetical protein MP228_010531 [Amoeboaphelidium protococcarum]